MNCSVRAPQLVAFLRCLVVLAGLAAAPSVAQDKGPTPVTVKHTTPGSTERDRELVLRANILAPAGPYLPTLYYRFVGETRYYSLPMLQVPGSLSIYAASVPGIFVTKDLEYYLESYDTQLRGPARAGDQKAPLRVSVVDPVVPPSQVVVRSDPSDAEVVLDGKSVGRTPWLGILPAGSHDLLLKKTGFLEMASTLEVPENRDFEILRALPPAAERAQFAVTSEPAGAVVTIDGQVLGETPLIAPSPDGEHTLTVEYKGYARAERVILFSKDRSLETSFTLQKLPPEPALAITTDPPGATVLVDDKELGKTPFLGVVPTGEHTVLLKLQGRRTAQAQILMPEDRDLDLRFSLEEEKEKRVPAIAISSDPSGAAIFIDDKELPSKTPYLGVIPPGPHKIKLTYAKYLPYEKKFVMPETNDIEITLALVPEPPPKGPSKVMVRSDPPDAEITVDGKPLPKGVLELPAGPHVAAAKKSGYRNVEERFVVAQGESMSIRLALSEIPKDKAVEDPLLSVRSEPAGATVSIDGTNVGVTPYSNTLKPGKHKLTVTLDGFKAIEQAFELPKDRAFELRYGFSLQPLRKTVALASAAETIKLEEKKNVEVVKKDEVMAAGAAPAPVARTEPPRSVAPVVETRVVQGPPIVAFAPSPLQGGPVALAGVGALALVGGVVFGVQAMNTAVEMANPAATDRRALFEQHTRQVQGSIGLSAVGVALAAGGAVWAAWPRAAQAVNPRGPAVPPDAGATPRTETVPALEELPPEPGGGDGAPGWVFGVGPTDGGAIVGVGGGF